MPSLSIPRARCSGLSTPCVSASRCLPPMTASLRCVRVRVRVRVCVCVCARVRVHICIYTYTYIHTYTHTYTHTHTHTQTHTANTYVHMHTNKYAYTSASIGVQAAGEAFRQTKGRKAPASTCFTRDTRGSRRPRRQDSETRCMHALIHSNGHTTTDTCNQTHVYRTGAAQALRKELVSYYRLEKGDPDAKGGAVSGCKV